MLSHTKFPFVVLWTALHMSFHRVRLKLVRIHWENSCRVSQLYCRHCSLLYRFLLHFYCEISLKFDGYRKIISSTVDFQFNLMAHWILLFPNLFKSINRNIEIGMTLSWQSKTEQRSILPTPMNHFEMS